MSSNGKIMVINGPNLNLLGVREVDIYGDTSLEEIARITKDKLTPYRVETVWFQSNSEGEIIDQIHRAIREKAQGIVINPGGLAHSSVSICDALRIFDGPVTEVHLSATIQREEFRWPKITARAANRGIIEGCGPYSYFLAILAQIL